LTRITTPPWDQPVRGKSLALANPHSHDFLFFITYQFGDSAKKPIKIAGIILFVVAVSAVIMLIIRVIIVWKRRNSGETPQE